MTEPDSKNTDENIECPRCKKNQLHPQMAMNALSRRDNETFICSPCGSVEAMEDFILGFDGRHSDR
jgi:hypothetical protein